MHYLGHDSGSHKDLYLSRGTWYPCLGQPAGSRDFPHPSTVQLYNEPLLFFFQRSVVPLDYGFVIFSLGSYIFFASDWL